MISWVWDSAVTGVALGGVVVGASRAQARLVVEREMRAAGAMSALACEMRYDLDWGGYTPTGKAMIASRTDPGLAEITWRDVAEWPS